MNSVLVVDDDSLVLMATAALVEDLGYIPVEAMSAAEALRLLASGQKFELIITDFAMPGMNGLELAEIANRSHPEVPVILATGYSFTTKKYDAKYTVLQKPFGTEGLARAVRAAGVDPSAT